MPVLAKFVLIPVNHCLESKLSKLAFGRQILHPSVQSSVHEGGEGVRVALICVVLLAAACAPAEAPLSPEEIAARAAAASPGDSRVAELYANSCRSCHAEPDSGAPLSLDRDAWDTRWRKGEAVLVQNTIGGFNGMPAGGQCFTCTAEDYRALIAFMAGRER
jgi:cytochrome c5